MALEHNWNEVWLVIQRIQFATTIINTELVIWSNLSIRCKDMIKLVSMDKKCQAWMHNKMTVETMLWYGRSIHLEKCHANLCETHIVTILRISRRPGPWFNIKMTSYQYRKSHCGDKTILRPSYLHNGISYTGKMSSLYWIRALFVKLHAKLSL